jgi:putative flippase GtrA
MNFLLKIFFQLPEKVRFVLIGGFNTAFGFGLFSLLYLLLYKNLNYLVILIINNFLAVSVAFFMLKFFVFQTQDNYWKEFIRCHLIYLLILMLNSILLYLLVDVFNQEVIISQFLITITLVVLSYSGHKHFSFGSV